ncbi:PfkB family carbohydrate kinase [Acidobacteria bacterium AH-259-D05]|nr:PfkB family carbohydrate kinase [Acidobacteria bacterium AH-259-D05]
MSSILAVGTVAYDSVKTPFGEVEEVMGGSGTYFSLGASFFTQVSLVACVGKDFRRQDVQLLESRNIDLEGLEYMEGQTFRWKGEYGYDLNEAHTLETQLNVLSDFHPSIPEKYRNSDYIFLGNIDPDLQRQVLSQVQKPQLVACDTMNYWISGHFESLLETLKFVDILLVNDAEARQLAQEANLVRTARKIFTWGPKVLVIKRGEYGVLMFYMNSQATQTEDRLPTKGSLSVFGAPAYPLENVFDPTGAGDTFAGGFVGYLAGVNRRDVQAIRQAIIFGSVMASFCVEKFSLDRLKELTFTEIELRYKEFKEMTHFEDIEELHQSL